MDGAKLVTDTVEQSLVGRRFGRAEAFLRENVDLPKMRILVVVGSEYCENQYH